MPAFVHSGYDRIPNDDYQTIDKRCIQALLESWDIAGPIWEPCAPHGSGIADAWPFDVSPGRDALTDLPAPWAFFAVTNPPYTTAICVAIARRLRSLVADGRLIAAALLLRSQWDHRSTSGAELLEGPPFAGLIRLRFRPWWSQERTASPIHSYQWLIFDNRHDREPIVRYWPRVER